MSDIDRLFYWRGITAGYQNYRGEDVHVPLENRKNLLEAMGVDISTPEAIAKEAYLLDVEPWRHWFAPLCFAFADAEPSFEINLHPADINKTLHWSLTDNNGKLVRKGSFIGAQKEETGDYLFESTQYSRRRVEVGGLAPDYYTLSVKADDHIEITTLAVCPREVYQEPWSDAGEKVWGTIIQLYTLTSERNWGIGDFTDLRELIEGLAAQGADVIGLNPLHALSPYLDDYFSPYSPSDRRYINPLYIDPYWIPDYCEAAKQCLDKSLLQELRASSSVDYVKVRNLKYPVFQQMFGKFIDKEYKAASPRYKAFRDFCELQGRSLLLFAHYEACHQDWVNAKYVLRYGETLESLESELFVKGAPLSGAGEALLFHCYLQWLAEEQLAACQDAAIKSGMKVGLIRDLAVGADGGGAEVNGASNLYCKRSAIGAPPDPFAHTGQNWGLPPAMPSELRKTGFKHFIELLRTNMSKCGALRIDHAMSLLRLWWCPPGKTADFGAYVYYPFPEMLGLLALESHLNKCLVIAEDLGVVPQMFRDALHHAKVFTNKVFYFEKEFDNKFKPPQHYDGHALAMINNHDTPTLVSWWNGTDLTLRDDLDLLEEGVEYSTICQQRKTDKEFLLALLYEQQLYPESWHGRSVDELADEPLIEAILVLASRTASKIFVLQLEDLLMMDAPVNVPGTFKQHKNWQRKIPSAISAIFSDARILGVLRQVNNQRKQ